MRVARILVPALAGFGLLMGAGRAHATSVERFDLKEMTQRAEVIVHGRVTSTECRVDDRGAIVTDVKLEVTELFKTKDGEDKAQVKTFTFTVYGGIVGNRGSAISGAPVFTPGEELLLFLSKQNDAGLRTAIGLAQGKYTIRLEGGRKLAYRNLEGLRLVDPGTGEVQESTQPEQGVAWDELRERVKSALEAR